MVGRVPRSHGVVEREGEAFRLVDFDQPSETDVDDTDFRPWKVDYDHRESGCLFCESGGSRPMVAEKALAHAVRDGFPVTRLHTLIIPKRHVIDYFGPTRSEWCACDSLVRQQSAAFLEFDGSVTAFNVGTDAGTAAGQKVMLAHLHLIPRRGGDVERPRGGVRHAIPGKGSHQRGRIADGRPDGAERAVYWEGKLVLGTADCERRVWAVGPRAWPRSVRERPGFAPISSGYSGRFARLSPA
jgi:diadenosine tetraphosphate (Ap4A) HIT family hydrolase